MREHAKQTANGGSRVLVTNTGTAPQHAAGISILPGQTVEVPKRIADQLANINGIMSASALHTTPDSEIGEIEHCFWPERTISEACRQFTDRALPVPQATAVPTKRRLRILFVLHSVYPIYGGIRAIGRHMHYLKSRGHTIGFHTMIGHRGEQHMEKWYINDSRHRFIPDITVGTYFLTMFHAQGFKGTKVGFIQGDEPAWPHVMPREQAQARKAFSLPGWSYITVAQHLAEKCRREYGSNVAGTLSGNGVDCLDFSPRLNDFKLRRQVFTIVRGTTWKGWPMVANVLAELKASGIRTSGCGFEHFQSPLLDEYTFRPSVPQMANLYSHADVYLSGSQFEGSPLTPLEAMACGCIPIVTPIGADYIKDGVNGFLVTNEAQMLQRAREVLGNQDLRWSMAQECLRTAESRTWERVGEEFETLLQGVHEQHGAAHAIRGML